MLAALGQLCSALYWRLNKFWTILISVAVPLALIFGSVPLLTWLDTTSAGRAAVEALAAFGRFLAASPWNAVRNEEFGPMVSSPILRKRKRHRRFRFSIPHF